MASLFFRSKRSNEQKRSSGRLSSPTTPNVSLTRVEKSESRVSHQLYNSLLNSSYEECAKDESFDVLPKTDYTYARSGSYSPRHIRKKYVNPNMSRRRLRGIVTPPVSLLDDDSDSDVEFETENFNSQSHGHQVEQEHHSYSSSAVKHSQSNASASTTHRDESYAGHFKADQLDFEFESDSDRDVVGEGESGDGLWSKEQVDKENLRIQQGEQPEDTAYRHYYKGMILRSGSRLKGMKQMLRSHDEADGRRKTMSVVDHSSADMGSVLDDKGSSKTRSRRRSERASSGGEFTTTTTTTVTKTLTEIEEDELNKNNNARLRQSSRSPARGKSTRSRYGYDESKRISDEYQKEKSHTVSHMYGLDEADDFSDTDSFSYSSSSYTSDVYATTGRKRPGFVVRSFVFVTYLITSVYYGACRMAKPVTTPVRKYVVNPLVKRSTKYSHWVWKKVTTVARYFILLDAWMLSRNRRRNCCLCLPLFLLLPLLLTGGQYMSQIVASKSSSLFVFPSIFNTERHTTHIHQGDTLQTINLHHEVKQILLQLQAEKRDWLTKKEIESMVQGMLNPQVDSLRVSLLNIANEGNSDQAALKVDQNDAKLRLADLEQQMAALMAKAKNLENDLADSKSQFVGTLTGDREKQAEDLVSMERALARLRGQVDSLEAAYGGLVAHTKSCCINDSALVAAIHTNVNQILAEMFDKDGKMIGKGSGAFAGWLNQNFVDRGEFERQLRLLTVDITDRISAGIEAQRSGHSSSFALPSGFGGLSEDAVKLIVEDALLKFSADRTGLPDYALESAGGSVLSVRCSETYYRKTALISVFGIPLWYTSNSPRTVIQPEVHPGQCWAFKGQSGYIVIQLSVPIRPTAFSLEHIPKSLSMSGNIDSSPKDFMVFGLTSETDTIGVNLGNFTYQTVGKPIQHFDVQIRNPGVFGYMELRVLNNHGSPEYTCLYRFRVHGVPQQ